MGKKKDVPFLDFVTPRISEQSDKLPAPDRSLKKLAKKVSKKHKK